MHKSLILFAAFALMLPAAEGATLQGTFDRTFDVRAGALFALDNENGRITVSAWNQPRIRVHAVKRVESRDPGEAKKVFDALSIVPTLTGGGVRIETKAPKRNDGLFDWIAGTSVNMTVTYEVTVPASMDLQIDNTNGAIEISGVNGSMRVSTTNGRVECRSCAGDIDAETTNGPVLAELAHVNPTKSVRLESTNGRVTVVLPKSLGAQLDASTTNGSIDTDLPVRAMERRSNTLRGTINGGGPQLRLRTTNGSISIEAR